MEFPESFRRCVSFLCVADERLPSGGFRRHPRATGFFMSYPISDDTTRTYLVTARHVVEQSRKYGKLYLRLNKAEGGTFDEPIDQDDFDVHASTDVAIYLMPQPRQAVTIYSIPAALPTKEGIFPIVKEGAEVTIAGLFQRYYGTESTQPIVRFGKVSLAQHEQIPLVFSPNKTYTMVDAVLVESVSWGGESGSPVFVPAFSDQMLENNPALQPTYHLIGLAQGHYPIPEKVIKASRNKVKTIGEVNLNAGIMVVIPKRAIIETMNLEKARMKREKSINERRKFVWTPIPDMLSMDGAPFTQDDYLRDLGTVFGKKDDDKDKKDDK